MTCDLVELMELTRTIGACWNLRIRSGNSSLVLFVAYNKILVNLYSVIPWDLAIDYQRTHYYYTTQFTILVESHTAHDLLTEVYGLSKEKNLRSYSFQFIIRPASTRETLYGYPSADKATFASIYSLSMVI